MARRKRYCSQCGSKTNDSHCEICGRATNMVTDRYKEQYLNLVEDDIETYEHVQAQQKQNPHVYDNELGDRQENLDHVANNMSFNGRSSKQKMMQSDDQGMYQKTIFIVIALIVVVGIFIALMTV